MWAMAGCLDAATLLNPTYDRWMYPFNFSNGSRATASTFGSTGASGETQDFDERDAQFYIAYDTSSIATPGQGVGNYNVNSITLSVTVDTPSGTFNYDPTYDPYTSYLDSSAGAYTADTDVGRPLELYGAGFRNGFTFASFGENGAYAPGSGVGVRNVYAQGYHGSGNAVDVSNSIDSFNDGAAGFDPTFLALGTTSTLSAGDAVTAGTVFDFQLNLGNADVANYVQEGLNAGNLAFVLTSTQPAAQPPAPSSFLNFATKENSGSNAPSLEVIPEPSAFALLLSSLLFFASRRNRRRNLTMND